MKKLFYFAATALSLSVIFASGWAAGVGVDRKNAQPASTNIQTETDGDCPDGGCEEKRDGCDKKRRIPHPVFPDEGVNFDFNVKMPVPPSAKIVIP